MSQGSLILPTSGTLSGLTLVQLVNAALANLASLASGATDPATLSGGVQPFSFWLDTSVTPNALRMRNAANNGWAELATISGSTVTLTAQTVTQAADDSSTKLASTAFVLGQAAASAPQPLGASPVVGTSKKYAREDHVHPTLIPSGTVMLFGQTAAPTGFTKLTTHNNKALRVVSGTAGSGGSVDFTTAFTSQSVSVSGSVGSTTLSTNQIPSHRHRVYAGTENPTWYGQSGNYSGGQQKNADSTDYEGGGQSHSHSLSVSANAINLAVAYVDVIMASKD
jgi:hypothetical protein